MKKVWKWILGIVIVLVVVAAIVGVVLLVHNGFPANLTHRAAGFPQSRSWNGPMMGRAPGRFGMMPQGGRFGFMPFGTGFGLGFFVLSGFLRVIVPLGVLVLVAYIFYQMGKRAGATSTANVPTPTPPPAAQPTVVEPSEPENQNESTGTSSEKGS